MIGLGDLEIGLAATLGADDTRGDTLAHHVIAHCVSPRQRQPLVVLAGPASGVGEDVAPERREVPTIVEIL